jgi:IS605 OrfB family transposase
MLNKTLTFGLGEIKGFNKKKKTLTSLDNATRKTIYTEILKGFRDFARLCNFTTSLWYSSKILKAPLEDLGYNTGYKPVLAKLKLDTHLNGRILNQAFGLAKAHFAGDHGKRLMGKGETVLPTHRSDGSHPLCFHKKAVELLRKNDRFFMAYNLFASAWAKKEGLPSWVAFKINLKNRDKTGLSQLQKIYEKEWQHGSGQLVRNKNIKGSKYIMHLVAKYEPKPHKELSPDTVMGIDLGVSVPAAIHFRKSGEAERWAMCIGNGRIMINARKIIRRKIVLLLRGLKRKDSPLHGPAREAARKQLRDLRRQEKRLMKTASQKLAAIIADQAKRNGAGVWQLEDLSLAEIKEGKPWLTRNWAAGSLIDAIKWQAQKLNIELKTVNPRHTSQRCSKCGHIDKDNRPKEKKGAAYFKCTNEKCGFQDHADKNAARNISIVGIDDIISKC